MFSSNIADTPGGRPGIVPMDPFMDTLLPAGSMLPSVRLEPFAISVMDMLVTDLLVALVVLVGDVDGHAFIVTVCSIGGYETLYSSMYMPVLPIVTF